MKKVPDRLFVWGKLPPAPWVSIVGTRDPSLRARSDAFDLARRLAELGITVASGGAVGIDSAAHEGALAGGGRTVVVAPTWLNSAYPKKNHALFRQILLSGGAYVTVAQDRSRPMRLAFFRRNEVLMALSHATVLGECGRQSGAKNAMQHARKLFRPRFALPFQFGEEGGLGLYDEVINEGAEVIADEIPLLNLLEEYGLFEGLPRGDAEKSAAELTQAREDSELSADERAVVRAVRGGAQTVDAVCLRASLVPERVQHAVLLLTLAGRLVEDERGLLRAC